MLNLIEWTVGPNGVCCFVRVLEDCGCRFAGEGKIPCGGRWHPVEGIVEIERASRGLKFKQGQGGLKRDVLSASSSEWTIFTLSPAVKFSE